MRTTLLLCLLVVAGVFSLQGDSCVQDPECGSFPYAMCKNGAGDCKAMLPGLGFNEATGKVYYAQICKARHSKKSNVTIKSVDLSGGVPTILWTQVQSKDDTTPIELYDAVGDNLYYAVQSRNPGDALKYASSKTMIPAAVDTGAYFQGAIDFDVANKKSFVCNLAITGNEGQIKYTIDRFDGILGQDASPAKTTLYTFNSNEACTGVRVLGNNLYFTVKNIKENNNKASYKLYKGTTDGSGALQTLFTLNKMIRDFDVTATKVFYVVPAGVYSSNHDGKNVNTITNSPGSSAVRVMNNKVVWNSGSSIVSADLNGDNVDQINSFAGTCTCKPGFRGDKCDQCTGQVQWLEGSPSCISINADGNPLTCNFDYECANNPYAYCDGKCKCREGFTGGKCTCKSNKITWDSQGIPSCSK